MASGPAVSLSIVASDGLARTGVLQTAHGLVETPTFMAVGTVGAVKAMTADAVRSTGTQCILGNTYHLMLRPGAEAIAAHGGLRAFVNWSGPILTDSGGFQIMSLSSLRKIDRHGVDFRSHVDGRWHRLTPAIAVEIQSAFDSTICMVLDECTPFPVEYGVAETSMELSMRWARLSKETFRKRSGYGLFGIVQGSIYSDLRLRSAAALQEIGFDGYAIGGLAVGEGQGAMLSILRSTLPHLPIDAPRYLMGVGTPDDIMQAVELGIDMFDCVIPTRAGRTARAYTSSGVRNLRNARYACDCRPLDSACSCPACTGHTRGYLHHLFRTGEMLGPMLLTWHNLTYYRSLMAGIRESIRAGLLSIYMTDVRTAWGASEEPR